MTKRVAGGRIIAFLLLLPAGLRKIGGANPDVKALEDRKSTSKRRKFLRSYHRSDCSE